jgi:hypothetical protein
MNEAFNIDRVTSMQHNIDPTGKKWELKGERGSSLVHARPNPDRADAIIPKEFQGKWTSPGVLQEKITVWLNKQWDKSDEAIRVAALKAGRTKLVVEDSPAEAKQTPEESLAALDPAIAEELGDLIQVETPQDVLDQMEKDADYEADMARKAIQASKKKAKKKTT